MRKEKASFLCLLSDDCELDHRRMDNVINEFVENAPIKGIKIKYGIYKNIDKNLSIATIYDYASMAAETVMEDYNHDYAYYTDELAQKRLYNQMIENDFTDALKNIPLLPVPLMSHRLPDGLQSYSFAASLLFKSSAEIVSYISCVGTLWCQSALFSMISPPP